MQKNQKNLMRGFLEKWGDEERETDRKRDRKRRDWIYRIYPLGVGPKSNNQYGSNEESTLTIEVPFSAKTTFWIFEKMVILGSVFAPPPKKKGMGYWVKIFREKDSAHQYGSNKVLTLIIEALFSVQTTFLTFFEKRVIFGGVFAPQKGMGARG